MSVSVLLELIVRDAHSEVRDLLARSPHTALEADAAGALPLHHAARLDRPRLIELLLEAGTPLEAKDVLHDSTALAWAAYYGSLHSAAVLVRLGADVEASNRYQMMPLEIAQGGLRGEHAADCPDRAPEAFGSIIELLTNAASKP